MKFAYSVDAKGETNGPTRSFSDREWELINRQKVIRWVLVIDPLKVERKKVAQETMVKAVVEEAVIKKPVTCKGSKKKK